MSETFDWLNPEDVGSFDDSFVGEFLTDDELGLGDEISRDPETGLDFSQPAKSFAEGGEVSTYTVKSGDIVSSIAQDHGTTTAAIQEANRNLDVDKIRVGQEIIIPVPDRPGYSNDSVRAAWTSQTDLKGVQTAGLVKGVQTESNEEGSIQKSFRKES
jgi:LysM repeat protein